MNKFIVKLWEKKESKKGFTLVELIVVLVILAILAAIMIPSMLGWIDKAKEKEIQLEARNALLAAQTIASEDYAKPEPMTDADLIKELKVGGKLNDDVGSYLDSNAKAAFITEIVVEGHKVTGMTYKNAEYTAVYVANPTGGAKAGWTITKTPKSS